MRVLLEFGLGLGLRGAFGPGLVWSGLVWSVWYAFIEARASL
jgi:hypothetical protein